MTDERFANTPRRGELPAEVERDLAQLRDVTARDVPTLNQAVARVRLERGADSPWRNRFMNATRNHPWLVTAGVAVVLAIAMLVVPISYERTTGTRVTMRLDHVKNPAGIAAIAKEMKGALGAPVRVDAEGSPDGAVFSFVASVPQASRTNPAAIAAALAKELGARGSEASVATAPIKEQVSGTVYAFARDVVIKVDMTDKSAAQVESEIRQKLAEAGIPDAQVSVSEPGANQQKVTMEMHHEGTNPAEAPGNVKLELTKNGQDLAAKGSTVGMRMTKTSDGGKTLLLDIGKDGQTTTVEIPHVEALSDAQLAAEITSRLQAAGISDLRVTFENGRLSVEKTP
jgi:hypothetical protein